MYYSKTLKKKNASNVNVAAECLTSRRRNIHGIVLQTKKKKSKRTRTPTHTCALEEKEREVGAHVHPREMVYKQRADKTRRKALCD